MRNLHRRRLAAPVDEMGGLLDRLAGPDDPLWPAPAWVPMRLERGLAVGSAGGHGEVRYAVEEYDVGRRVRFRFAPGVGLDGWHELRVQAAGAGACVLTHEIQARPVGLMVLLWPLAVRPLHDAVLEDLLDNAELVLAGRIATQARWSPWVRLLRGAFERSVRASEVPTEATLVRSVAGDGAGATSPEWWLADAWQVPLPEHVTTDPADWHRAIFRRVPLWVGAALVLRNLLAPVVGIRQGDSSSFDVAASSDDEVLVSTSEAHLDFHASVHVGDGAVTLSTLARPHNTAGRLYLAVVRRIHPVVVRAMLLRALADLAEQAPRAGARELARRRASV